MSQVLQRLNNQNNKIINSLNGKTSLVKKMLTNEYIMKISILNKTTQSQGGLSVNSLNHYVGKTYLI